MKPKVFVFHGVFLLTLGAALYLNGKYEVIALSPLENDEVHDIKVLTWNVHCPNVEKKELQSKIVDLILDEDADIVLLNEFTMGSCQVIDSLMSLHYPHKNDSRAKVMVGDIIYSKITLAESDKFKFKGFNNTIYSKIKVGADTVYVVGCHLEGNNHEGQIDIDDTDSLRKVKTFWGRYRRAQEKRREHVHLMKEIVQKNYLPMIVMGDMNDFQYSAPMDSLKEAGMKNAWWEGGFGYGATYHQGLLRLRIDHIYYNDRLKLEGIKVIETKLSDHNPVVASFSLIKE